MKRAIVVCEGDTEKEFVGTFLQTHFNDKDIYLCNPKIKKSNGGIVKWGDLKKQIEAHLKCDKEAYVSTLIDYYGLKKSLHFPDWEPAHKQNNTTIRMDLLEQAMKNDIETDLQSRFIPYIQLHEFEALLFCERNTFDIIPKKELIGIAELNDIFKRFPNPEDINDHTTTSPSHRMDRIIDGYNKVKHMNILCEQNGLNNIRAKCPRFNEWISRLESL